MTRYLVLVAYEPRVWDDATEQVQQGYFRDHAAFSAYVEAHGVQHASAALADADQATTLRHVDGDVRISDGPFAETVEQIGGYYDVELPDLDHAIAAAALLPAPFSIEIRPTIISE